MQTEYPKMSNAKILTKILVCCILRLHTNISNIKMRQLIELQWNLCIQDNLGPVYSGKLGTSLIIKVSMSVYMYVGTLGPLPSVLINKLHDIRMTLYQSILTSLYVLYVYLPDHSISTSNSSFSTHLPLQLSL